MLVAGVTDCNKNVEDLSQSWQEHTQWSKAAHDALEACSRTRMTICTEKREEKSMYQKNVSAAMATLYCTICTFNMVPFCEQEGILPRQGTGSGSFPPSPNVLLLDWEEES
jgi:hypothetical protein